MMESRDNHMTRYNVRFLGVGDGIRHGRAMTSDRERAEPSARLKEKSNKIYLQQERNIVQHFNLIWCTQKTNELNLIK
jgi:hypothetical protein